MKIIHIIYNKGQGGLERMYMRYTDLLQSSGNQVCAMIPPHALIEKDIRARQIEPYINPYVSHATGHLNPFAVRKMRAQIEQINPDMIFVHNARPLRLLTKALNNKYPLVTVHHGGNTKRLLQNSDYIICVARYMVHELKDHVKEHDFDPEKLYELPNVIDVSKAFHARQRPKRTAPITLGVLGRLTHEKGVDIFLESLRHLPVPIRAIIAGDGALKNELQKQATDHALNVEFWGWVEQEDKDQFFEQCDILIVPSRHESFGLSILEGWAHSIPVISTDTKGGKELINPNQNGLLVERETPQAMAHAIMGLIDSKEDPSILTKNAYDRVISKYSMRSAQERLNDIMQKILTHHTHM